jgi:hypothetical protein
MKTLKPGINQKQWNVGASGRNKLYREWRMNLRLGGVQDIDQLEYVVMENGAIRPVGVVELCKAEDWIRNPNAYLAAIDNNAGRVRQQKVAASVAGLLGIPAFYLVFEDRFDRCFVKCLTMANAKWYELSLDRWQKTLRGLWKG